MSQNKRNQHYLPQFYLKKFSYNKNDKMIGVFNLNNNFYYQKAPLKNQGSKNFFYGKDGIIENELSKIEGKYSQILNKVLLEVKIPNITNDYNQLLDFLIITKLRNPLFIENIKDSQNFMFDGATKQVPNDNEDRHIKTIKSLLKLIPFIIDTCADLEAKLLYNSTNTPFIISDNPLISYNQFLEKKNIPYWKSAYGSLGYQSFFPISPTICILLYDPAIYIVGKSQEKNVVEISDVNEINDINIMQFLNCTSQVFFNELISEKYILRIYEKSKLFKKANIQFTKKIDSFENGKYVGEDRYSGNSDIEINLKISKIKIKSDALKLVFDKNYLRVHLRPHVTKMREKERLKSKYL